MNTQLRKVTDPTKILKLAEMTRPKPFHGPKYYYYLSDLRNFPYIFYILQLTTPQE